MKWRRRTRVMLITGGSGLLGRHLQQSPSIEQWDLVAPAANSLDIRQRDRVLDTIIDWKPQAVVHLAYRRDDRPTTVDGSRSVAEAAASCGARLIHLSSDVVFGGRAAPYRENDATSPVTDYGRMKADAEVAVMTACPQAVMVRTSLMYSTDQLAPIQLDVQRALKGEQPMSFFTDEYRCPVHAADVAAAVGALLAMPQINGPLHVAGPEPLSRADFAAATAVSAWREPSVVAHGAPCRSVDPASRPNRARLYARGLIGHPLSLAGRDVALAPAVNEFVRKGFHQMRVVVNEFMSLDGVVQAPGGADEDTDGGFAHGGWSMPYFEPEVMGAAIGAGMEAAEALLFGRRTWQGMASAWPGRAGDADADQMNAIKKYVASRTLRDADLTWNNTTLLSPVDAVGDIAALRDQAGGDIVIWGSASLVTTLFARGLVDELNLMIEPIVLGGGKRIFPDDGQAWPLQLVNCVTTRTGVQVCTYRPAPPAG